MSLDEIREVFGTDFAEKYDNAVKSSAYRRRVKLEANEEIKREIAKAVKEKLKPEAPRMMFVRGDQKYDIILVKTRESIEPRPLRYGVSVPFDHAGMVVYAILQREDVEGLQPDTHYLLIGEMRIKPRESGGEWRNFTTDLIMSVTELKAYLKD